MEMEIIAHLTLKVTALNIADLLVAEVEERAGP